MQYNPANANYDNYAPPPPYVVQMPNVPGFIPGQWQQAGPGGKASGQGGHGGHGGQGGQGGQGAKGGKKGRGGGKKGGKGQGFMANTTWYQCQTQNCLGSWFIGNNPPTECKKCHQPTGLGPTPVGSAGSFKATQRARRGGYGGKGGGGKGPPEDDAAMVLLNKLANNLPLLLQEFGCDQAKIESSMANLGFEGLTSSHTSSTPDYNKCVKKVAQIEKELLEQQNKATKFLEQYHAADAQVTVLKENLASAQQHLAETFAPVANKFHVKGLTPSQHQAANELDHIIQGLDDEDLKSQLTKVGFNAFVCHGELASEAAFMQRQEVKSEPMDADEGAHGIYPDNDPSATSSAPAEPPTLPPSCPKASPPKPSDAKSTCLKAGRSYAPPLAPKVKTIFKHKSKKQGGDESEAGEAAEDAISVHSSNLEDDTADREDVYDKYNSKGESF